MLETSKIDVIADNLRQRITGKTLGVKGRIPSIVQLSEDFHAARETVRQALVLLQSEGLVYQKGRTYFANYQAIQIPGTFVFDQYLTKVGLTPYSYNLEEPRIIALPDEVSQALGLQQGSEGVFHVRLQGTRDIPMRITENWYTTELASGYIETMKSDPYANILGEIRHATGLAVTKLHESIVARPPTQEEQDLLKIPRTNYVFSIKRKCCTDDWKVLAYVRAVLVCSYFSLEYRVEHRSLSPDREEEMKQKFGNLELQGEQ
jgi:GntR family transcriptional regulator